MPYSGGSSGPITLNTVETPDTYYLATNPLGNSIILGEAADATFDHAHAAQTDPALFIHSHNQSTTEWGGLVNDGTYFTILSGGSGRVRISASTIATGQLGIDGNGIYTRSNYPIGWSSSSTDATAAAPDTLFRRAAAATVQMGTDVNGAAVNQTIKAHDGITGTDILGASLTLAPGKGTGAAVSGSVIVNRDLVKATGTTAQTYGQGIVVAPSKILSNTSATAQTVATINTTTLSAGGVTFYYNVAATSGTAADADTGSVHISWNNVGGTVAATAGTIMNSVQSNSSGTLAATPTVTVATNVVSIKLTPTWVTIVPTGVVYSGMFHMYGQDSVVPL